MLTPSPQMLGGGCPPWPWPHQRPLCRCKHSPQSSTSINSLLGVTLAVSGGGGRRGCPWQWGPRLQGDGIARRSPLQCSPATGALEILPRCT